MSLKRAAVVFRARTQGKQKEREREGEKEEERQTRGRRATAGRLVWEIFNLLRRICAESTLSRGIL